MNEATLPFSNSAHHQDPLVDQTFAERLLNLQLDIWRLESEQGRLRMLLRMRRAMRQHLARQARLITGVSASDLERGA